MGFALWIEDDVAWAQGTHEYRPMGAAVIALGDRFRAADFHRYRKAPSPASPGFAGFFASVGHLNEQLEKLRRRGEGESAPRRRPRRHALPGL